MKEVFKDIIFSGDIPRFDLIKKILGYIPFFGIIVFFNPELFIEFGEFGWQILLFIVFIRPLSDTLPKLRILKKFVLLRKELGIISGAFIILHGIGFFFDKKIPLWTGLMDSRLYDLSNFFGWGMLGFYIAFVLTVTSNIWSMKFFGKNWKRIQQLTYLFFIFGAIHIGLVNHEKIVSLSIVVTLWGILWILAFKKIVLWK